MIKTAQSASFILLLFFLFSGFCTRAQVSHTLYWMHGIPQSQYLNAGVQPHPNIYIGVPALSSLQMGIGHSSFAMQDILKRRDTGMLYFDDQGLLSSLSDRNNLSGEYHHELLGFGFRTQKNYFSFSLTERAAADFTYPADLFRLLIHGNDYFLQQSIERGEDVAADLSDINMNFLHYREWAIGYSRQWTPELSAGARAKIVQGLGNVSVDRFDMSLLTHPDNYELLLSSNLLINTNIPFQLAPLDSLDSETSFTLSDEEIFNYFVTHRNMGFALDIGGIYEINDEFTVSLGVNDIGFVNWTSHPENFAMQGEFAFEGIEFNDFFDNDNENQFDQIRDSITELFDITETANTYRTMLPAKIFIAGAYDITSEHKAGLLAGGYFYSGTFRPSLTLSYNFSPTPHFGSTMSYTIIHGNYRNLGLGFYSNLGPVQIYAAADNIIAPLRPHTLRTATLQLGINIVLGYKKKVIEEEPSIRL